MSAFIPTQGKSDASQSSIESDTSSITTQPPEQTHTAQKDNFEISSTTSNLSASKPTKKKTDTSLPPSQQANTSSGKALAIDSFEINLSELESVKTAELR